MNREALRALKKKLFFTTEDVAHLLALREIAQVFSSRQVTNGVFLR